MDALIWWLMACVGFFVFSLVMKRHNPGTPPPQGEKYNDWSLWYGGALLLASGGFGLAILVNIVLSIAYPFPPVRTATITIPTDRLVGVGLMMIAFLLTLDVVMCRAVPRGRMAIPVAFFDWLMDKAEKVFLDPNR